MGKLIEVQLGEHRGVAFYDMNDIACLREDQVILEVERGTEYGRVVSETPSEHEEMKGNVAGKILRQVTEGDCNQIKNNRGKARDAISICVRKINERRIEMQIVKAEYTFDCSKIIFFFTADGRVDFRGLVKDLAKIFRVRIELKQIGVRDKAKIVGGYGVCGRPLCCSSYMKAFHPLSIKMAKEQALPLNPSRISGCCGRMKCCMSYEFVVYRNFNKGLPHLGEKVNTPDGRGRVKEVNILRRTAVVDLGEGKLVRVSYKDKDEE